MNRTFQHILRPIILTLAGLLLTGQVDPMRHAAAQTRPGPGDCPQPRFTQAAPAAYLARKNPETAKASTGRRIYEGSPDGVSCATCHGLRGDGKGELSRLFSPPPRNFACARTVRDVPDGQLFWIIRFGSPGTAMPAHPKLKDADVWQVVHYLRQLAR